MKMQADHCFTAEWPKSPGITFQMGTLVRALMVGRRALYVNEKHRLRHGSGADAKVTGMYGPPRDCKKKVVNEAQSA